MATRHQIGCINKNNRSDPYTRIARVGGVSTKGERWSLTLDEAIKGIESGQWEFYTQVGGHVRNVQVVSRNGTKYLRTDADRDTPDNLLSLPECP
ncbi:DUF3892 domain-containing protein [Stenotrophomonas sp.]|uniref:DUF3892 domain-containing protein n=1 Tax=Stenotrophomonas sp. TaxID=69392 RepID=UPI0019888625|nr:DUF3892 domain-containing protein [Stenotrophomonas sp.]MBD3827304.1 DUF3892 domain-containing protein [Stenotrophomonas sp.]